MSILKQKKSNFIQENKQISQNESSKILESVEINKLPITCYFTPIKVWNLESALSLGAHLLTGGQWYILAYKVMGAFKLQQMVNMHCQLSFIGSREYKNLYFGHKISTFDYFYGGNLVKMGFHNQAKEKNAHFGGLGWKERLKWTRYIYVGKNYKLSNEVPCSTRGRKALQINEGFLKGVSSTSFGHTASRRILNTANIMDPCHLSMQRQENKVNIALKSLNERSMYQIKNKTGCWKCQMLSKRSL